MQLPTVETKIASMAQSAVHAHHRVVQLVLIKRRKNPCLAKGSRRREKHVQIGRIPPAVKEIDPPVVVEFVAGNLRGQTPIDLVLSSS